MHLLFGPHRHLGCLQNIYTLVGRTSLIYLHLTFYTMVPIWCGIYGKYSYSSLPSTLLEQALFLFSIVAESESSTLHYGGVGPFYFLDSPADKTLWPLLPVLGTVSRPILRTWPLAFLYTISSWEIPSCCNRSPLSGHQCTLTLDLMTLLKCMVFAWVEALQV